MSDSESQGLDEPPVLRRFLSPSLARSSEEAQAGRCFRSPVIPTAVGSPSLRLFLSPSFRSSTRRNSPSVRASPSVIVSPPHAHTSVDVAAGAHTSGDMIGRPRRSKKRKLTSDIWNDFTPMYDDDERLIQAQCLHCDTIFPATKQTGSSQCRRHRLVCREKAKMDELIGGMQPSDPIIPALKRFKFDKEKAYHDLVRMIVLHELPFRMVEYEGILNQFHQQASKCLSKKNQASVTKLAASWPASSAMVGGVAKMPAMLWLLAALLAFAGAVGLAEAAGHNYYDFIVKETTYTKLCRQKTLLTVNGTWPGPTITARKGETVIVNVYNQGPKNITIHWHGVDQPRNPWYDGPEFITQCPIMPGKNFTYEVILSEEEGTLWWHAHSDLDRAGVHGALIVHPEHGKFYPYEMPHGDHTIILGECWISDLNKILEDHLRTGGEITNSNAHTINGEPGDLFRCSSNTTFNLSVQFNQTYLLRIINAGLDTDMFFGVGGHNLTVVGTDGRYLRPFTVENMMISPGQTMDVLLKTKPATLGLPRLYYMASRTYASNQGLGFNNSTATAILEYPGATRADAPVFPKLPHSNDSETSIAYTAQLRSLNSNEHPVKVTKTVDERMVITLAVNTLPCTGNTTCDGPAGSRLGASLNNVSFEDPRCVDILDAYYFQQKGVYEEDFPNKPPFLFNFTNDLESRRYWPTNRSTKVKVVEYGKVVEVVFQDTAILGAENHPMHLHGYAFYVVGRVLGSFNETTDPATYNLVDPPYQNTVTMPKAGWAAMRFNATNSGVWFMHCHFDRHTVFGMSTTFIVKDRKGYIYSTT